jgi:hypothetical protein
MVLLTRGGKIAQLFKLHRFAIQLSPPLLKLHLNMDPLSVTASVMGIIGVGSQAVQSAREMCGSYRDAEAQMKHAKAKSDMLEAIRQNPSLMSSPKLAVAQSSFEAIGASFPANLHVESRRRRLLWAARDNEKATRLSAQLTEIEILTMLSLGLDHSYVLYSGACSRP